MSHDTTKPTRPTKFTTNPPRPILPRPPMTEKQRAKRSDELAELRGAIKETARHTREDYTRAGDLDHIQFTVDSATRAEVSYLVDWYAFTGAAYCTCPAGQQLQGCWHAGVARKAGAAILAMVAYERSPEGQAELEQEACSERHHEQWRAKMYGQPETERDR